MQGRLHPTRSQLCLLRRPPTLAANRQALQSSLPPAGPPVVRATIRPLRFPTCFPQPPKTGRATSSSGSRMLCRLWLIVLQGNSTPRPWSINASNHLWLHRRPTQCCRQVLSLSLLPNCSDQLPRCLIPLPGGGRTARTEESHRESQSINPALLSLLGDRPTI